LPIWSDSSGRRLVMLQPLPQTSSSDAQKSERKAGSAAESKEKESKTQLSSQQSSTTSSSSSALGLDSASNTAAALPDHELVFYSVPNAVSAATVKLVTIYRAQAEFEVRNNKKRQFILFSLSQMKEVRDWEQADQPAQPPASPVKPTTTTTSAQTTTSEATTTQTPTKPADKPAQPAKPQGRETHIYPTNDELCYNTKKVARCVILFSFLFFSFCVSRAASSCRSA
jgi:hypothetical protein